MEATASAPPAAPDQKKSLSTFFTIFAFLFAMFVLFDQNLRNGLGELVGAGLEPIIGFDGTMPVLTLIMAGVVMTLLTVILRHFFTDYVAQAESQKIVSAFNKELRKARVENNLYKIKKLTEQQNKIMKKSMDMSASQMKLMPITMLVVIPIFAWLSVFMGNLGAAAVVHVPWAMSVDLNGAIVLPMWVLLYSLISIPFGQILTRSLRYFEFRKRLGEIEAGTA